MSIRVLVVDDSAVMRALLQHRLERAGDITVIGTACDANEARGLIRSLDPDVITLDIEMPGMDGLSFLEKIMTLRPTPVVLVSGVTEAGAAATVTGLRLGAVGCFAKSQLNRSAGAGEVCALTAMVREAASARLPGRAQHSASSAPARITAQAANRALAFAPAASAEPPALILIGASTGGVEALHVLLADFPANCPPTVIVQHINPCFAGAIAQSLDRAVAPSVMLAQSDLPLMPGQVLIAPGAEKHLMVAPAGPRGFRAVLRAGDPVCGHRPSVDCLFHSAAAALGPEGAASARAVLLTGMGRDGAEGLNALARLGTPTIAQDEASSVVFGMPRAAIELGAAASVLPLGRIAGALFSARKTLT